MGWQSWFCLTCAILWKVQVTFIYLASSVFSESVLVLLVIGVPNFKRGLLFFHPYIALVIGVLNFNHILFFHPSCLFFSQGVYQTPFSGVHFGLHIHVFGLTPNAGIIVQRYTFFMLPFKF